MSGEDLRQEAWARAAERDARAAPRQPEGEGLKVVATLEIGDYDDAESIYARIEPHKEFTIDEVCEDDKLVRFSDARRAIAELRAESQRTEAAFNAVIGYMLGQGSMEEPMEFLRCWNNGDFDSLRREWPDAPAEIYYADPLAEVDKKA